MRRADLHAEVEVAEWNLSNLQTIVNSGPATAVNPDTTINKQHYQQALLPPLVCMPIEPNTSNSLTIIDPNDLTRETAEATSR